MAYDRTKLSVSQTLRPSTRTPCVLRRKPSPGKELRRLGTSAPMLFLRGPVPSFRDHCSTSEARCPRCRARERRPRPEAGRRQPARTLASPPRPGALAASQDSCSSSEARCPGRCSPATYMSPKRGCSPAKNAFFLDFYMRKAVGRATRSPPPKHHSVSEPSKTRLSSRQKAFCCGSPHRFRSSVHSNRSRRRS